MIEILNLDTVRINGVIHGSVTVAALSNKDLAPNIQAALVVYLQGLLVANDQAAALNAKLEEIKQAHADADAEKLDAVIADLKKTDTERKRDAINAEIAAKQAELAALDE